MTRKRFVHIQQTSFGSNTQCMLMHTCTPHTPLHFLHVCRKFLHNLFFLQSAMEQVLCLLALESVHFSGPHIVLGIEMMLRLSQGVLLMKIWKGVVSTHSPVFQRLFSRVHEPGFSRGFSSWDRSGDRCHFWRRRISCRTVWNSP